MASDFIPLRVPALKGGERDQITYLTVDQTGQIPMPNSEFADAAACE